MQAINARHRGKPQIRYHKPLPARRHHIGINAGNRRFQGIDASRLALQRLVQRQAGGDIDVYILLDRTFTLPDFRTDLAREIIFLIIRHRGAEVAILQRTQQVTVGYAIQRQFQLFGVHRLNRDQGRARAWQNIAPARKTHAGIAVTHIDGDVSGFRQCLAIGRGKPFAEREGVARPEGHALHTKLLPAIRGDGQARAGKLHEGRIIDARLRQGLREIHADARAGGVGDNHIINNPKAIFANRIIQRQSGVVTRLQRLRQPQCLHLVATSVGRL